MLDLLIQHLQTAVELAPTWGFLLIFFFMAVESSFIPFPSEIIMIPAGFLAARGELTFGSPSLDCAVAAICGILGSIAGAVFNYYLAAKLGEPFLRKYGKWFFIKPEALDRSCEVFNQYGDVATFVCRLIPAIRQLISLPAGVAKMPFGRFVFFTALGAGIWTALLTVAGWGMGRSSAEMTYAELVHKGKEMVSANLPLVIGSAAVLALIYWGVTRLVMRSRKSSC